VSTGRGEFDGVGAQVSDDLAETDGVSVDQDGVEVSLELVLVRIDRAMTPLVYDGRMSTIAEPRARTSGEVFTRRWIVDLILDLSGYTPDRDLGGTVAVEPSCGKGAFLVPMVERLIESCRRHDRAIVDAMGAIVAADLLVDNVDCARRSVAEVLQRAGIGDATATMLSESWITQCDYLLTQPKYGSLFSLDESPRVDFVIGNPPYIRPEDVPPSLYDSYRSLWPTMLGRADVYVGFFEAALKSLAPGGVVGFICADRWMRNQYGRGIRSLISTQFSVDLIFPMHDVDAFETKVSAYPAIVVLRNGQQSAATLAEADVAFASAEAGKFVDWFRSDCDILVASGVSATRLGRWVGGEMSWPGGNPAMVAIIEDLNAKFAPLENPHTGTRVGIGVATGADELFVTTNPGLVESDRLLPLTMSQDGVTGEICWGGTYLVNPWDETGTLVDLAQFPKLRKYFEQNGTVLRARHTARKAADKWYRTIDKVDHALTARPKLLFPDLKMTTHPVLEPGGLYPHHNLYYVVSDKWDLQVLGGLLLSKVAEAFVSAYCVKMRGGTLRFQAQYLRRIRLPEPDTISAVDQAGLADAFARRDAAAATEIALRLYGIEEHRERFCAV